MLDGVVADARANVHPLALTMVSESETCQRAALMIASLIMSWAVWAPEQVEEIAAAGGIGALVRCACALMISLHQ